MCDHGRCAGKTLNGSQCKRSVTKGSFCYQHSNGNDNGNTSESQNTEPSSDLENNKNMKSPRINRLSNHKSNGLSNGQEKSLYERLGGIFPIAAVVDIFSEEILASPIVGMDSPNPQLREWSRSHQEDRLPGLKWMRTLWVADITGGPYKFIPTRPGATPLGLENAHKNFRISPEEFDEVARILAMSLDYFKVPAKEKNEVLTAFMAHKPEVIRGFVEFQGM